LSAHWRLGDGSALHLVANLSKESAQWPRHAPAGRPLWGGAVESALPPWSVFWSVGAG
jgi:maltooligosyltrehalose trehalohydrolase